MKDKTNKFILDYLKLPIISDIYSFADCIGLSTSLLYILSNEKNDNRYKIFSIPKKDGSLRTIYEPSYSMKIVQRWILNEILYKIPISQFAFGFRKGMSVPLRKNAEIHKDNLFIFKLDLKDFFPSIHGDRIFYLFNQLGYNTTVANMLCNLCTLNGSLPQGAVTSPCIANLVCNRLDIRISKYCSKREIAYSRYADDLTFSANDKTLIKSIFSTVEKIIENEGFKINEKKTQLMTPKSRKCITGITVNNKEIKASKKMKQKVRAMIHKAIVTGDYSQVENIRGYVSYISSIEDDYLDKIKKYITHFQNEPICMSKDVVDAYNANKFFVDLPDFLLKQSGFFVEPEFEEQFISIQGSEREEFLTKYGVIIKSEPRLPNNDNIPF
jgi:retron-type reverse transcriptase